jgi:hypothetical protein
MSPLNHLLNHVADMEESHSFFRSQITSRGVTLLGGLPLEVCALAQNLIRLPWLSAVSVVKMPVKLIGACLSSRAVKECASSMPGVEEVFATALKVLGYVLGTIFTATIGFALSPYLNFRLHLFLGLISDEKAKKAEEEAGQQAKKEREAQERVTQMHYHNLILAMKCKIAEKEQGLLEERSKRQPFPVETI